MYERRIDGAPREMVPRKGRVHHQDVADKLIVGAVIREVVQDQNRVEKCDCKNENRFGNAKRHYMPHRLLHAGIISLGELPRTLLESAQVLINGANIQPTIALVGGPLSNPFPTFYHRLLILPAPSDLRWV